MQHIGRRLLSKIRIRDANVLEVDGGYHLDMDGLDLRQRYAGGDLYVFDKFQLDMNAG